MEKNYNLTRLNRYPISYNIETVSTPLKQNILKNKEIILNSFLQETYNQKKTKAKANLLYENMIEEQNNKIYININEKKDKNKEKTKIIHNNKKEKIKDKDKLTGRNDQKLSLYYQKNNKNKLNLQDNFEQNYKIANQIKEKNYPNNSSVIPPEDNQMSKIINSRNLDIKTEKSYFQMKEENKKIKRHKTVYIKKNFSVERNLKSNKNKHNNISKDDKDNQYYYSNKKNEQKYCTPSSSRKQNKNISNKNSSTNNINSNVNIFNFGMQYNNDPHYFIRNSKMFHPYFNEYFQYNNHKINPNVNHDEILNESAIIIQSAYRGCVIRFQINNLLKTYKGIEFLDSFFKNKFWVLLKKNLSKKNNIIKFGNDSKLSISSISGFSAIASSNFVKSNRNSYKRNFLEESHEVLCFLNKNNMEFENKEENYLNNNDNEKNKKVIWNKKMANKNNSIISNIINYKLFNKNVKKLNVDKKNTSLIKAKEKYLKIIVTKKIAKSRFILQKYFFKFYYNGIFYNSKLTKKLNYDEINININSLKITKLKKIIENKKTLQSAILFKYFIKFKIKGILKYIENHQYMIINGGRLKNIEEDYFFIYEFNKNKLYNVENNRNIKSILLKISKLRKIIYDKKQTKIEIIKLYFNKFRMAGIRYYMQVELKKKLITKKLILKSKIENYIPIKEENKNNNENKKYQTLNKLILKYKNYNLNCCKNIFDRWNLRAKLFSMITKDKEKKKKRRIKKRHNKKLAANINNINNNNINNLHINNLNDITKTNKINNITYNPNIQINIKHNKNEINYEVGHPDSIIFANDLKITDYSKITKFINKINSIITNKFYFFNFIIKKGKKEEIKEEEKNNINKDVDFFMDDSSESED